MSSPQFTSPNESPVERRPWGRGRRGPPPFIVQLLRAPLTLNNLIALFITKSVLHTRRAAAHALAEGVANPGAHAPCPKLAQRTDHILGLLALLFLASTAHNVLSVIRFHRIRRRTFGQSMCGMRRRFRRGDVTEEERADFGRKMKEMGRKMPSIFISSADVMLSVAFLGMWILTTLLALREGKVELGVGYASVGALVAFILNFMVGVNGLKMWARVKREQRKEALERLEEAAASQDKFVDEKAQLLDN